MCEGGSETAELLLSSVAPLRQRGLELYVIITKPHGYIPGIMPYASESYYANGCS